MKQVFELYTNKAYKNRPHIKFLFQIIKDFLTLYWIYILCYMFCKNRLTTTYSDFCKIVYTKLL